MPAIGDVLGERFRVVARLGEGAMGAVYRAENIVTGKQVAIKWMHPHVAERADSASRMLREAQAASRLSHPNVVDVYDIVHAGSTLFLVMELLEGETLRSHLFRNPHPKVSDFISLLLPALDGVAAAHDQGVIHRDLKPENIFLVRERSGLIAKVVDFGVAKLVASRGMTLTDTGVTMGTPLYMSLEQLRGDRNIDARADVYAFGAMLYEAVCGHTPYRAETLPELAIKIATTDPPPVKTLRPELPTPLARVIDWAVARERAQRVPDIRTLILELEPFSRENSFQRQMTNPNAVVPLLAATRGRDSDTDQPASRQPEPRTPEPVRSANSGHAERMDAPVAGIDTLTARELASGRRARNRTSLWALAVTLAAVGGVAGYVLLGRQAESERILSDRAQRHADVIAPPAAQQPAAARAPKPAADVTPESGSKPAVRDVATAAPPVETGSLSNAAAAPAPASGDETSSKPGPAEAKTGAASATIETGAEKPDAVAAKPNAPTAKPDAVAAKPDAPTAKPGAAAVPSAAVAAKPDTVAKAGAAAGPSAAVTAKPDAKPGAAAGPSAAVVAKPGAAPAKPLAAAPPAAQTARAPAPPTSASMIVRPVAASATQSAPPQVRAQPMNAGPPAGLPSGTRRPPRKTAAEELAF